jgi:hypothetical protein
MRDTILMTAPNDNQPPWSNKGGTQVQNPQLQHSGVQAHLDWLTYTAPYLPDEELGRAIGRVIPPYPEFSLTGEVARSIHGYTDGQQLGIGSVSYSPDERRQKIAVQITGQGWQDVDRANIPPEAILRHMWAVGKPTRIDFALDLFEQADTEEVYRRWKSGGVKTRAQAAGLYISARKQDGKVFQAGTTYIGASTSYQQMRIYDKAKEQGVKYDWTRIELIARKEGAERLARGMLDHGLVAAGQQACRDFAYCKLDWYVRAVDGPAVHLAPITHPEKNTLRWIMEDVLPVIEQELLAEAIRGDKKLLHALGSLVGQYRDPSRGAKHWSKHPPKRKIDDVKRYTMPDN